MWSGGAGKDLHGASLVLSLVLMQSFLAGSVHEEGEEEGRRTWGGGGLGKEEGPGKPLSCIAHQSASSGLVILAVLCVALGAWSHGTRTLGLVWNKRRKGFYLFTLEASPQAPGRSFSIGAWACFPSIYQHLLTHTSLGALQTQVVPVHGYSVSLL